jgi:DNA-binding NarL/FixJ family response regulator
MENASHQQFQAALPSPAPNIPTNLRSESKYRPAPSLWPDFLTGQPDHPVRVLLIDDDARMRMVIAQELLADLRTDLVAQGRSLREGRTLISQHVFDVMLVDLNLGDGIGFELIQLMKMKRPMAEAVVISAMEDEEHALHAFELGATGYVVKNSWFGNFPQAVLQVVNGGASITPNLARRLLHKLEPQKKGCRPAGPQEDQLTDREKSVLKMVASGYTSCEIASRMTISFRTVNTHIKNIYSKLQVHSRAQAVNAAANRGIF